jgi:hypothetical protein
MKVTRHNALIAPGVLRRVLGELNEGAGPPYELTAHNHGEQRSKLRPLSFVYKRRVELGSNGVYKVRTREYQRGALRLLSEEYESGLQARSKRMHDG